MHIDGNGTIMANISIRGLDKEAVDTLKGAAAQIGVSLNSYVVELLRCNVGVAPAQRLQLHHDLDALAGTWSEAAAREFEARLAAFEQIDEDLWR
jgi:hypothetical protein